MSWLRRSSVQASGPGRRQSARPAHRPGCGHDHLRAGKLRKRRGAGIHTNNTNVIRCPNQEQKGCYNKVWLGITFRDTPKQWRAMAPIAAALGAAL